MRAFLITLPLLFSATGALAQPASYTGFIEGRGVYFPQDAANDSTKRVGDGLFRNELILRPAGWLQIAAGLDVRANSHDQVEDDWRLDFEDRTVLRPRAAVRRLAASVTAGGFTLDVGKQFIRWGRADIIYPTDRFAPRDYLNVIDSELLPVIGARAAMRFGNETLEGIWVPQLTPSRLPLLDQRWAPIPPETGLPLTDGGSEIPNGRQLGVRWRHSGSRIETALSFFDGFNHLPDIDARFRPASGTIDVIRVYPAIRMYGADIAWPTRFLTLKTEVALVTSPPGTSDEYVLYVVEIERQVGEWLLDVGYAGEDLRKSRAPQSFAPDRRIAKSIIGRASYTLDPQRTVIFEGAARQDGDGYYGKIEYSQGLTEHWRLTLTGVGLAGEDDDFLGQYQKNSHLALGIRFSF